MIDGKIKIRQRCRFMVVRIEISRGSLRKAPPAWLTVLLPSSLIVRIWILSFLDPAHIVRTFEEAIMI